MGKTAFQDLMRLVTFTILAVLGFCILAQSLNGHLSFIRINLPIATSAAMSEHAEDRVGGPHSESESPTA